uniref:Secreted protein n=1 Tax=Micrurus spixii TaxID=129469 RepID=A0A2D4LY29_9SAUR
MWAPGLLMSPWATVWDTVALLSQAITTATQVPSQRLQGKVQKSRPGDGQKRWQLQEGGKRVLGQASLTWETNVPQGSPLKDFWRSRKVGSFKRSPRLIFVHHRFADVC